MAAKRSRSGQADLLEASVLEVAGHQIRRARREDGQGQHSSLTNKAHILVDASFRARPRIHALTTLAAVGFDGHSCNS